MPLDPKTRQAALTLNESPSEKEGKLEAEKAGEVYVPNPQ